MNSADANLLSFSGSESESESELLSLESEDISHHVIQLCEKTTMRAANKHTTGSGVTELNNTINYEYSDCTIATSKTTKIQ